jgi:glyoxylase-like metal-dependent hydrolase (beta-lactamase superfamily II)
MKLEPDARRVVTAALFVLALGSATVLGRQQDVEIVVEEAGGAVSVLYGRGGNIGLSVGEDGLLLVDSQFADISEPIRAELAKHTADGGADPVFLVNTHHHGDHVGGNAQLAAGGRIVAHENVRRRLSRRGTLRDSPVEPVAPDALPDVTYADGLSIWFNGEEVRLIHVPGAHTDGDSVVWFTGSNVVHCGDALFLGRFPFIDVPNGGRVSGAIAGLEHVLATVPEDARFIPGHGKVCGAEEVRGYVAMLRDASDKVRAAIEAGKTIEQMKEEKLLDAYSHLGDTEALLLMVAGSLAAD